MSSKFRSNPGIKHSSMEPGQFVRPPPESESETEAGDVQMEPNDDSERSHIRSELSTMSFEDLIKLKDKLGAKVYNKAVFGQHRSKERSVVPKQQARDNKNRPRVMGVKRPVPLKGKDEILAGAKAGPRDPRFDANCGEFDAKKFKENFSFVSEIKERELIELREKLKTSEDPKEQKKIKYLIQRMQNQDTEERKLKIREQVREEQRQEISKAKKEFKKPHYTTDRERKARELVKQYLELKESGKLNKHLEKRRKKNAGRDRKKFSFD